MSLIREMTSDIKTRARWSSLHLVPYSRSSMFAQWRGDDMERVRIYKELQELSKRK